jgi:hypothetical protein
MDNIVKNTKFDNLVNYTTRKSSGDTCQYLHFSSDDPTSLAHLSKNNQIIEYHLSIISENEFNPSEKISEPTIRYNQ